MAATPLSVFSYVRNEAATLDKSLATIRPLADELVVVDTGSTDSTVRIAEQYADRIVTWPWRDDFGAAARFAESLCTHRFVCKWDGDWWLQQGLSTLRALKDAGFREGAVYDFGWVNEYDLTTLEPFIYNRHQFIYDREAYAWTSPIHTHLVSRHNRKISSIFEPEILVYHYKGPAKKHYRFAQTKRLIAKNLPLTTGPARIRLLKYGALNALFGEDWEAAAVYLRELRALPFDSDLAGWLIEPWATYLFRTRQHEELQGFIEKTPTPHPALTLFAADLELVRERYTLAEAKYREFLKTYPVREGTLNLNVTRYRDHPKQILAWLAKQRNK